MKLFQKAILVLAFATGLLGYSLHATAQSRYLPNTIEKDSLTSFRLTATNGQKPDYKTAATLSCFVFLSPECPLCKNYAALLTTLKQTYSKQVSFFLIVPGDAYSMKEIKKFRKNYLKNTVLYKDATRRLTQYLHATTTPEVVLVENKNGVVVYQGAIDNWAVSLGRQRAKATENYLLNAIDQYLHNQPVTVTFKQPVGCLINDF